MPHQPPDHILLRSPHQTGVVATKAGAMFSRVLVGIDEETHGRDAVALAQRLVGSSGHITLAHVHQGSRSAGCLPRGGDRAHKQLDLAREQESLELLAAVKSQHGFDADVRTISSFRIGEGLHRLAERTNADLLVVGSSRKGRNGRVFLRDETLHAINGAPCAVAIAPLDYARYGTELDEIGVGYDGSEASRSALALTRLLASRVGCRVCAFAALPLPAYEFPLEAWDTFTQAVHDTEQAARDQIESETGVTAYAACGEAADEIAVFSGSVDMLVVGSRDYGPRGRLVHGSTVERLARFARTPLMIYTRGSRAYEPEVVQALMAHA